MKLTIASAVSSANALVMKIKGRSTEQWLATLDDLLIKAEEQSLSPLGTAGTPVCIWPAEIGERVCIQHVSGSEVLGGDDLWVVYALPGVSPDKVRVASDFLVAYLDLLPSQLFLPNEAVAWVWSGDLPKRFFANDPRTATMYLLAHEYVEEGTGDANDIEGLDVWIDLVRMARER